MLSIDIIYSLNVANLESRMEFRQLHHFVAVVETGMACLDYKSRKLQKLPDSVKAVMTEA